MLIRITLLILLLLVLTRPFALADEDNVLKGGIKGAALRTEDGLVHISDTAELIKESSANIIKEATRKDTTVFRGPNVIGGGIVIPPVGGDAGVVRIGDLPMRRKQLNQFVQDIEQGVLSLNSQIDALIIPENFSVEENEIWNSIKIERELTDNHLSRLKALASDKKLIGNKIGKEALAIYDSMNSLSKLSIQLLELLRKTN